MTIHSASSLREIRSLAGSQPKPRSVIAASLLAPVEAVMRELRMRRDTVLLSQMDEAQLSDIGITRSQIVDAVRSGRVSPMTQAMRD